MNTDKIYAEAVANEYSSKKTTKVMALKKLDKKAKLPSMIVAMTLGVISALLLGVGMCLSMGVIGAGDTTCFITGVVIGVIGIIGVSVNYPIFKAVRNKGKQKYSHDILRLAKEISDSN